MCIICEHHSPVCYNRTSIPIERIRIGFRFEFAVNATALGRLGRWNYDPTNRK